MGNQLKGADNSLTLQIRGDGPLGGITCVSDSEGNVRGYVNNPAADVPRKQEGKLDVGGAVGSGSLTVIKDLGLKDPYVGSIALVSGEIAEDVTAYFAESEQIPNACALGVLVRKDSGAVITAGGYLIQLLPGAGEDVIEKVERGIRKVGYVTGRLSEGESALDLVREVLGEFEIEVLEICPVEYRCYCSREKVERTLLTLGRDELEQIVRSGETLHVDCQFCDKIYDFTPENVQDILNQA